MYFVKSTVLVMSSSSSSTSSSSNSSNQYPAKRSAGLAKWQRLRREIFEAVLYANDPVDGVGSDIYRLVRLYHADYSMLPMSVLKKMVTLLVSGENKKESFEVFHCSMHMPIPKLPNYKKENGAMVETTEEGRPRSNKWWMTCYMRTRPTQKKWKRDQLFLLEFQFTYERQHKNFRLPAECIDTYRLQPSYILTFKREGKVSDMIKESTFLYYLRDLILSGTYRMKRKTFCKNVVVKGRRKNQKYKVLCGNNVDDSDVCVNCWRRKYMKFVRDL